MLLNVLARAAGAIDKIIDDPIEFLSNLVAAVKQGLFKFVGNIGKHLKDGLMGWLLGELAAAGITDAEVARLQGHPRPGHAGDGADLRRDPRPAPSRSSASRRSRRSSRSAEVFKVLVTEGPAGLWKWIVDKVDNLVDTVLGGIKDLVITKVITAGITWLISLLNPASAFVKACKMIYDVIMFFVERGSQIMELVNAIIDSVRVDRQRRDRGGGELDRERAGEGAPGRDQLPGEPARAGRLEREDQEDHRGGPEAGRQGRRHGDQHRRQGLQEGRRLRRRPVRQGQGQGEERCGQGEG